MSSLQESQLIDKLEEPYVFTLLLLSPGLLFLEGVTGSTQTSLFIFVKVVLDILPPSGFNAPLCIICQQDEDGESLVEVKSKGLDSLIKYSKSRAYDELKK